MNLRRVPPDKIVVPDVRVTARFDEETWAQFQSSIREVGTIAPIICCEMEPEQLWPEEQERKANTQYIQSNGKVLVLVDGLHRLVETRNNGAKVIDVAVVPGDMVDVLTKNLFVDHARGKTPPSEMVTVIEALTKEYHLDSEKIAAKTGMGRDYVEKLQAISELTPACRAALDEGKIGVGQAFALTKLKDPIRQETVLHQCLLYRWKTKELEEYIKDVLKIVEEREEAPPSPGPQEPYLIQCAFCHNKYPITEIANPATCRGCAGVLYEAIAIAEREAKAEAAAKEKAETSPS
jgi:ParB-like chromosome segregation protein Spo0J